MNDSTKVEQYGLRLQRAAIAVDGLPLGDLAKMPGPFLTCYLHAGSDALDRLDRAIEGQPEISVKLAQIARSQCPEAIADGSICIVANSTGGGIKFGMAKSLMIDVLRYGAVPSLGSLVESEAVTARPGSIALELGRFSAARAKGRVAEELEVIGAIRSGLAASVLVHDDQNDNRLVGGDRLVDLVTANALSNRVPLTIIPPVPPELNPRGGVGAILTGNASAGSINRKIVESASMAVANFRRASASSHRAHAP